MRIISEFHDYYDVVQAQGQDQSLLFVRSLREEEIEGLFPFPHILTYPISGRVSPRVQQYIVGFCGRIYPVIHLSHSEWVGKAYRDRKAVCHTLDDVDRFVESCFREKEVKEYTTTKNKNRWSTTYWNGNLLRGNFVRFFAECEKFKDTHKQRFLDAACPIFVARYRHLYRDQKLFDGTIAWNASLREHEFFRVFDTFTAFQEIAMFMSNLAVPLKPIPEVPDKVLAGAKGFNEWSFRKPPKER